MHNIFVILADITNVNGLQMFQLKNTERSVTKTGIRYLKFDTAFHSTFCPSPPRDRDGSQTTGHAITFSRQLNIN
jgi:hypothetical protein